MINLDNIVTTEEERTLKIQSHILSDCKMKAIVTFSDNKPILCNRISKYVLEHISEFINPYSLKIVPRGIFITKIRNAFPNALSNTFDSETYKRIYTGYKGKIEAVARKLVVKEQQVKDILYYKRKTVVKEKDSDGNVVEVTKNPGDIREIRYKYVETPRTKAVSYLAKYGKENTKNYIEEQLKNKDLPKEKVSMYKSFIEMFNVYGFEVLLKEALEHRKKVYDEYLVECVFESVTFFMDSRILDTFIYNKKKGSKVKVYMKLAIPYTDDKGNYHKHMIIPIKVNDRYHGDLTRFNSTKLNNHTYLTIMRTNRKNVIDIRIGEKRLVSHRQPTEDDIYCAFDVNTNGYKINGTGDIRIDHKGDEKIVSKIAELTKQLQDGQEKEKENAKKQDREYNPFNALSRKKRKTLRKLSDVMKEHNRKDAAKAVIEAINKGCNHIIMENLAGDFSKSKAKDKENDQNFNNKTAAMQLSSIKNNVKIIC